MWIKKKISLRGDPNTPWSFIVSLEHPIQSWEKFDAVNTFQRNSYHRIMCWKIFVCQYFNAENCSQFWLLYEMSRHMFRHGSSCVPICQSQTAAATLVSCPLAAVWRHATGDHRGSTHPSKTLTNATFSWPSQRLFSAERLLLSQNHSLLRKREGWKM